MITSFKYYFNSSMLSYVDEDGIYMDFNGKNYEINLFICYIAFILSYCYIYCYACSCICSYDIIFYFIAITSYLIIFIFSISSIF